MTDPQRSSASRERVSWPLYERILFRFAFCYIVLYYAPPLLRMVPGLGLSMNWYRSLWNLIAGAIGIQFFHLNAVQALPHPTGSGDTALAYIQQALIVILALIAGIVWTILDRRRQHYIRLHGGLRVLARYALAFALLSYAVAKIVPLQFGHLGRQLTETYGQSSPMALLWNFMAFSTPYTMFGGCAELLPAVLLVFRKTALLGSLIAFAVLLNVVALNFCYDVPVKLYSLNLLLLSAFLILPDARRLFRIFVLNLPVAPADLREPFFAKDKVRRGALILKIAVLALVLGLSVHSSIGRYSAQSSLAPSPSSPLTTRGFHWVQEYPYNK
jgi:hypothetical protein